MSNKNNIILDSKGLAREILLRVREAQVNFGLQWNFPIELTPDFLDNLIYAHTKDILNRALTISVRTTDEEYLKNFIVDNFANGEYLVDAFLRAYMELGGESWHCKVSAHVPPDGFDIWKAYIGDNGIIIDYVGDYRIMEWELDHVHDGVYYQKPEGWVGEELDTHRTDPFYVGEDTNVDVGEMVTSLVLNRPLDFSKLIEIDNTAARLRESYERIKELPKVNITIKSTV